MNIESEKFWEKIDNVIGYIIDKEIKKRETNSENNKGLGVLHEACRTANLALASCLIPNMNVNEQGAFGWTPLHIVAMVYNDDTMRYNTTKRQNLNKICQMLIDKGADITLTDKFYRTPIQSAVGDIPPALTKIINQHVDRDFEVAYNEDGEEMRYVRDTTNLRRYRSI